MRSVFGVVAAISLSLFGIDNAASQSARPTSVTDDAGVTSVEDVVVVGATARQLADNFVDSVGASVPGRKLATWRDQICVGVAGMQPEPARLMADRVSDWGHSLGLRVGQPGCRPTILILAAADGDAAARALVASQPRNFRTGVSGTTHGAAALREFQNSGKLVRWWHVSLPVIADTSLPAVRLRGQDPISLGEVQKPSDVGSYGSITTATRLSDNTRDELVLVTIIVEDSSLDEVTFSQLVEYVSMISLAQIDFDASPSALSILNLFQKEGVVESLTEWDRAYLQALYATSSDGSSLTANDSAIADALVRNVRNGPAGVSAAAIMPDPGPISGPR